MRKINLSCHYLRRNDHLRRILLKKPIIIIEYPHQWRSGSMLKAGRQEMQCSIPGRFCQPSRSEFSVVFSNTRVNTG